MAWIRIANREKIRRFEMTVKERVMTSIAVAKVSMSIDFAAVNKVSK